MKKVLLLGAGLVTKPLVDYLLEQDGIELHIGSRTLKKAEDLIRGHKKGFAFALNVDDQIALEDAIKERDLVISLVPYTYHLSIAKYCLKYKKNMITTSYVSPEMRELDKDAKNEGILILNEIGLDPGIDHMSAMRIINKAKRDGGKVLSFKSYCGGLPHPKNNDNPLGYKFSWSPRGVLMAGRNNAKFLEYRNLIEVPNSRLFATYHLVDVPNLGDLEAYPNRDSVQYKQIYGLEDAHTIYRGTLRNLGWCNLLHKMVSLNMFSMEEENFEGMSYLDYMSFLIGEKGLSKNQLIEKLSLKLNLSKNHEIFDKFEWIGLFSKKKIKNPKTSRLDLLLELLLEKISLKEDELDMIVMHHEFLVEYKDKKEKITSTLIDFGIPKGDSAMARTVSLPAAIAAQLILDDKIQMVGVKIPVEETIYEPVLKELEKRVNLKFEERVYKI